ncbi:MAG: hypothetical protein KF886_01560 [Candidatus Hydrogenedentes bacterium]|nr:hypothetical protein [Candidatus Hydrogenedentota bacterium]
MLLKAAEIEKGLLNKGFQKALSKHRFFKYYSNSGVDSGVKTMLSHGARSKTLSADLIGQMARQCGLSRAEFEDLINCPLSRDKYEEKLRQAGRL